MFCFFFIFTMHDRRTIIIILLWLRRKWISIRRRRVYKEFDTIFGRRKTIIVGRSWFTTLLSSSSLYCVCGLPIAAAHKAYTQVSGMPVRRTGCLGSGTVVFSVWRYRCSTRLFADAPRSDRIANGVYDFLLLVLFFFHPFSIGTFKTIEPTRLSDSPQSIFARTTGVHERVPMSVLKPRRTYVDEPRHADGPDHRRSRPFWNVRIDWTPSGRFGRGRLISFFNRRRNDPTRKRFSNYFWKPNRPFPSAATGHPVLGRVSISGPVCVRRKA